ncbi:MAG: hypothetical protein HN377_13570 [Alphaproteobacteria bacterium]|nr:hypothetical protein [Alphaproteobacteria bacterium]
MDKAEETTDAPKSSRASKSGGRRGARNRSDKATKTQAPKPVETATETKTAQEPADDGAKAKKTPSKSTKAPAPKDSRSDDKKARPTEDNDPVKGLGGHVPAFLMATPSKKK